MKSHLNSYKQYLTDQNKSKNTITSYLTDLDHYFSLHQIISRENIQSYKKQIAHLSATSINRKLSSIKSYNEYLISINVMNSICIIKSDFIKIQHQSNPTNVTRNEVNKFLERVKNKPSVYQSRNIAIMYVLANTAIRREECANIKLVDLNLEERELKIRGKGNKEGTVILNDVVINAIKEYLVDRAKHKNVNSEYLFLSERGNKLSKESINDIVNSYRTPKCKITPHQFRHNWASSAIEDGVDLGKVRDQLRHSSIAVTDIYTHSRKDQLKKCINKLSFG